MKMVEIAQLWAARGVPVLPCKVREKAPACRHGVNDATTDPDIIAYWWGESSAPPKDNSLIGDPNPEYNVGIAMGHVFCALDVDGKIGIDNLTAWLKEAGLDLSRAPCVRSPGRGGGRHLYFLTPPGVEVRKRNICKNVDLFGLGVYILAPGSRHPENGERYKWQPGRSLTDCEPTILPEIIYTPPEAVFERMDLNAIDESEPVEKVVRDRCEELLADAIQRGVPGARNDTGLRLACQLRDNFLDQSEAADVMRRYHAAVGDSGYTLREAMATLKSTYRKPPRDPHPKIQRAVEGIGAEPPAPAAIPTIAREGDEPRFIPCDEFVSKQPNTSYCIKGLLPGTGSALLFADPNVGKSFLALDMMMHVALGLEWAGMRVRKKTCVYFAGEGLNGLKARVKAWLGYHEHYPPDNVYFWTWPINLVDPTATIARANDMVEALPEPPGLIIIDTLASHFGAGDENKQEDMMRALQGLNYMARHACVVVIHHSGHGEKTRERGASSLGANVDIKVGLSRKSMDEPIVLTIHKNRDGRKDLRLFFDIETAPTPWIDEDGDPINSAVIVEGEEPEAQQAVMGKNQAAGIVCLRNMVDDQPGARVPLASWFAGLKETMPKSSTRTRVKNDLIEKGLIRCKDGFVELV